MTVADAHLSRSEDREHLAEAEALLARGERRAAVEALERGFERDPFDDEAPLLAAMICFEQGELARAADLALVALRRRPFHPAALNLLGVACLDAGHTDLARKILKRATGIAPGHEGAKRNFRATRNAPGRSGGGQGSTQRQRIPRKEVSELLRLTRPRLSVCVVVRDSVDGLETHLGSYGSLAHEVIVVDATPDGRLAETLTQKRLRVVRCSAEHDASAAHNTAYRSATGDWILMLQPDERLAEEALPMLEHDLDDRASLWHLVEIRHVSSASRVCEPRLFRNAPGVRYEGRVFPRVHPSLEELAAKWGLRRGNAGATVESDNELSYATPAVRTGDDPARLAADDLQEQPENTLALLQSARLDLRGGQVERALDQLQRLPDRVRAAEFEGEEIVTLSAHCLLRLERFAEVAELLGAYHKHRPPTRNTLFLQGLAARAQGDPALAAEALQRCRDETQRASYLPPLPEILGGGLPNMLGAALLDLGELDEARASFDEALARDPDNLEARMGLLGLRFAAREIDTMLHELDELIRDHGDNGRVWSLGAILLGQLPTLAPVAEQLADEACQRFPHDDQLRRQRGEAHLRCGNADRALEAWGGLESQSSAERAAVFAACWCSGAELPPVPVEDRSRIEVELLRWLQIWWDCSAFEALDRALLDIGRAAEPVPGLPVHTASWLRQIGQTEAADRIHAGLAVES